MIVAVLFLSVIQHVHMAESVNVLSLVSFCKLYLVSFQTACVNELAPRCVNEIPRVHSELVGEIKMAAFDSACLSAAR